MELKAKFNQISNAVAEWKNAQQICDFVTENSATAGSELAEMLDKICFVTAQFIDAIFKLNDILFEFAKEFFLPKVNIENEGYLIFNTSIFLI